MRPGPFALAQRIHQLWFFNRTTIIREI